jgi:hypothetical protein
MPERRSHDYYRQGITSLFAAFNIADGMVISELHRSTAPPSSGSSWPRSTGQSRRNWVSTWSATTTAPARPPPSGHGSRTLVPHALHAHRLVLDQQIERWFAFLTSQLICRGLHKSQRALEADIRAWIKIWNDDPRPFVWKKTAENILNSLARYCRRISGSGH